MFWDGVCWGEGGGSTPPASVRTRSSFLGKVSAGWRCLGDGAYVPEDVVVAHVVDAECVLRL